MKKVNLTILITALSFFCLLTSGLQAQNFTTSAQYGSWSVNGYTIYNDVWGSGAGAQSLWAYDQGNWGVWSDQPNTGGIKSYPNVSYPVNYTVSSMPTITSSFNVTTPGWGSYESTYDIWYSNNSYEIMLWMNYYGSVGPISYNYGCSGYPSTACPVATNISVGGQTWNLYSGSNGSNTVYSFVRTSNTSSGTVNITQISQYLANNGYFSSSSTLQTIQFGFEITSCSGGANFQVNSYGVSVGSSSSGGGSSTTYYQLKNRATGLLVDGMGRTSNGSNCGQWSLSNNYNQDWQLVTAGSYVKFKNRSTGLYLDGMGRTSNGSAAGQWSSSSSYNQQWLEVTTGSYVKFQNRATGLYLDGMGRTSNGSDMGQWSSSSSYNQQFTMTSVKDAATPIASKVNADVKIYPNPVSDGMVNVSLSGMTGNTSIRLLDQSGKIVQETQSANKSLVQMNLNVAPGFYIMQVVNTNNTIVKKLIVK